MSSAFTAGPRLLGAAIAVASGAFILFSPLSARGAGLLIADGGAGGVLAIEEHSVRVTIDRGLAVTEVSQVFRNTETRQVEALYVFPVPRGASVAEFSMWIDGAEMVGEVIEKERARAIYESYKRKNLDPGLLEQVDEKTFEMRIFPIAAGAEQRVRLVYYQELDVDHDRATYVYPLTTVGRPGLDATVRGSFALTLDVRSDAPIVAVVSPSHGGDLVSSDFSSPGDLAHVWRASLELPEGSVDRDVVVSYDVARPRTGLDAVVSTPPEEDGYLAMTLALGDDLGPAEAGADYVFVLDVSGSMANEGKLLTSRQGLGAFLEVLSSEDRMEVIAFNGHPMPAFERLLEANEGRRAEAQTFLDEQRARGSTDLELALRLAYRYADPDRRLNVVVLSDGLTAIPTRNLASVIAARPASARVFCIGVGNEVDRPVLARVAADTGGLAAFISSGDDLVAQAGSLRRKLLRPAASSVRLRFEGSGVSVGELEPRSLPSLFHGAPIRVYGRYQGGGAVTAVLTADVQGQAIERRFELQLPEAGSGSGRPEIERMWAWHRIARLREVWRDGGAAAEPARDEIIRLGQAYSIATELTSFIVLENDAEYRRWKIERRNVLRIGRDRAAQTEVDASLANVRRRSVEGLGPATRKTTRAEKTPAGVRSPSSLPVARSPLPSRSPSAPTPGSSGRPFFSGGGGGGGPVGPLLVVLVAWVSRRRRRLAPGGIEGEGDPERVAA